MKEDFQEILITRGRRGSNYATNGAIRKIRHAQIEEDDIGTKIGMRPSPKDSYWDRKCDNLGEHLAPLRRYLRSQVGRPWNDIYSEICAVNSKQSAVGAHIFQHLDGYVKKEVQIIDGIPHSVIGWGNVPQPLYQNQLYVDGQGILCIAPKQQKAKVPKKVYTYEISPLQFLVIDKKGVWFEFWYSTKYEDRQIAKKQRYYDENLKVWTDRNIISIERQKIIREIYINTDRFEITPYYQAYRSSPGQYERVRLEQKFPEGLPYLISCWQLNTKEKKRWNLL